MIYQVTPTLPVATCEMEMNLPLESNPSVQIWAMYAATDISDKGVLIIQE